MSSYMSTRVSAFEKLSNKTNDDLSKTKMCVYFKVGCKNPKCQFAHAKEELRPTFCRFGNSCRKDDCWFVHPEDEIPTTEELFQYCLESTKFIEKKPWVEKPKKPTIDVSQFKININEEDDEDNEEETNDMTDVKQSDENVEQLENPCEYSKNEWSSLVDKMLELEIKDEPQEQTYTESEESEPEDQELQSPTCEPEIYTQQVYQQPPRMVFAFPPPRVNVTLNVCMSQDEMIEVMNFLNSRNMNPKIVSLSN